MGKKGKRQGKKKLQAPVGDSFALPSKNSKDLLHIADPEFLKSLTTIIVKLTNRVTLMITY